MSAYIEKEAAIKAVCDSCGVMPDGEKDTCPYKYEGAGCREYDKIIDIPPADVRPVVRGRWRKIGNNSDGTSDYECSACLGIMMHVPDDDEHPMVSFCSMCGADMREDKP